MGEIYSQQEVGNWNKQEGSGRKERAKEGNERGKGGMEKSGGRKEGVPKGLGKIGGCRP